MDFGEVWRKGRWLVGEFEVGFENGIGEVGVNLMNASNLLTRRGPDPRNWNRILGFRLASSWLLILLWLLLLLRVRLLSPGSSRSSLATWRRSCSFYGESTMERKPCPRANWGMLPARTGNSDEDCERSLLVWFSRKYGLRNFCFVFIFHFDFVVRVSIYNGICISAWAWINFSCWVALFAKSVTKVNSEIQFFFSFPSNFLRKQTKIIYIICL